MPIKDRVDALLADLGTLTDIANAAVLSTSETRLKAGEVRPAAILFIDVVGFSEVSRRLTPEQLAELIDSAFRIFELTAKSCGGYLDKVIGDAALYVFAGHPNYAPPCEGALTAALRILERAVQISQTLAEVDLALAVRCGISFGEVARQAVGGADVQITVMGDTVNLAQRLEASAVPGTVLTNATVIGKAGGIFDHEPLGTVQLKGVGEHEVFKVTAKQLRPASLRGSYEELSPFTGRGEQLAVALDQITAWAQQRFDLALDSGESVQPEPGRNRLLVVRGEPAVGKSRFALELLTRLADRLGDSPLAHATAHCTPNVNLHAFAAELAQVAGLTADNLPQRWEALCQLAEVRISPEYARRQRGHLPLLAYLLGCHEIDTQAVRQGSAAAFESGCRLALRACCELAGLDGWQVLLVVEDLQWLGGLRGLLTDLLQHTRLKRPLIVIGTARREFDCSPGNLSGLLGTGAAHGESAADVSATEPYCVIKLPLLDAAQGAQLLQQLLPELQLPEAVEADLHVKACGLPYYYEEFARMLAGSGMTREVSGELAMPIDIRMLLLGRLDQLSQGGKELAMRASVLGRNFSLGLLREVEQRLGLPAGEAVPPCLDELVQAAVVVPGVGDSYIFEHVLMREAAYDSLLTRNRRLLHASTADVLADGIVPGTAGEWDTLPQLIDHLERAERFREAHRRCCELMIIQAQSGRTEDWDKWDARARELDKRLTAAYEAGDGADQADRELYLRAVGVRQLLRGELAEARAKFDEALELAQQAGDEEAVARLLGNIAMVHHRQGELAQAISKVRRGIEICSRLGLTDLRATQLANLGVYELAAGNHEAALLSYSRANRLHTISGNLRGQASAMINTGYVLREEGDFSGARKCFTEALSLAQQLGDRLVEGVAWSNLGVILYEDGKHEEARRSYLRALQSYGDSGRREKEMETLMNLGGVTFDLQEYSESVAYLERALSISTGLGNDTMTAWLHLALAKTLAATGCFEESMEHIRTVQQSVVSSRSSMTAGLIDCCLAHYYFRLGDVELAAEHLQKARLCLEESGLSAGSHLADEIRSVEAEMRAPGSDRVFLRM